MGLLCDYFLAANDDEAAQTIDWIGGPSRPPEPKGLLRRRKVDPRPTVQAPGLEPAVMMSTLEHLLTGRPLDDLITQNARRQVAERGDGEGLVMRLSHGLVDALAESDATRLHSVAEPWSQTEEFFGQGEPDVLIGVLDDLAALARQGRIDGQAMYCWLCL